MSDPWTITSEDDDSVYFRGFGVSTHIRAGSWRKANDVAHVVAKYLEVGSNLSTVRSRLMVLSDMLMAIDTKLDEVKRCSNELEEDITGEMAQELAIWKRRALAAEAAVKASNHPFVCPCGRVVTLTTEAQP